MINWSILIYEETVDFIIYIYSWARGWAIVGYKWSSGQEFETPMLEGCDKEDKAATRGILFRKKYSVWV